MLNAICSLLNAKCQLLNAKCLMLNELLLKAFVGIFCMEDRGQLI